MKKLTRLAECLLWHAGNLTLGLMMCLSLTADIFAAEAAPTTVIHAGTLLAIPGQAPATQQSILLSGNRILSVQDGFVDVSTMDGEVRLIDLSELFVLPGLMDMHVHLTGELSPDARSEALYMSTSMSALRSVHFAGKTLKAGFTTVRDLGGEPEAIFALRDAIRQGFVDGPRVFAAGSALAATGGHGDVDGYKAELLKLWTQDTICDGPYDCRRATRHAVKFGTIGPHEMEEVRIGKSVIFGLFKYSVFIQTGNDCDGLGQ